jgi:hypothetical protein
LFSSRRKSGLQWFWIHFPSSKFGSGMTYTG